MKEEEERERGKEGGREGGREMKERKREVGKEREILQYQYVQTVMPDQVVFHLLCSSSLDLRVSNNKGSISKILLK